MYGLWKPTAAAAVALAWLASGATAASSAELTRAKPQISDSFSPDGAFPLPDLAALEFRTTGGPSYGADGYFRVPVRFTVVNQGQRPAGAFKIALYLYERQAQPALRLVKFTTATPGQKPGWYAWSPPLDPGDRQTFSGRVSLSRTLAGKTVLLLMHVDSTAGEEPSSEKGRVAEAGEKNNWADSIPVRLPRLVGPNRPVAGRQSRGR